MHKSGKKWNGRLIKIRLSLCHPFTLGFMFFFILTNSFKPGATPLKQQLIRMKKIFFIAALAVFALSGMSAQNVFFPTKEGMTLVHANLNAKGKTESYTRQIVRKVEGGGSNMSISYIVQPLDKNQKRAGDIEVAYTVGVHNGMMEWDLKNFAAPGTEGVVQIEGDRLQIPTSIAPGDKLSDVHFTMTVNLGFKIKTEVALTEQECLAVETITVPAGTFKCYKMTQTSTATAMRRSITTKAINWYAPGIGSVKSETFDGKGKLQSIVQLQSLED
jgi:hypothetical protein